MGNQACCAVKDSEADQKATTGNAELSKAEAVPVLDDQLRVAEKKEDPTYEVTLDKSAGGKLGLDVDYMAERRVLPVMGITGGLAEQWNHNNTDKQVSKGDSVVSVNDVKGDVATMLEKCKTAKVLTLVFARKFNYDHLVSDIENLVTTQGCGAILIRLSWHSAGVYKEEFAANAGLPTVALNLLRPISDKYVPDLISHADLWALAANVAIRCMSGPSIATRFGRPDSQSGAKRADGDKGVDYLRTIFHAKDFDDKAIVALSGAPGFDSARTESFFKFDNSCFKELLAKTYTSETTSALLDDSTFKLHTESYANDQSLWFTDFAVAWKKLQENGHDGLRDVL